MKKIRYKAFDKDFKCRGFLYEVGKEYEIQGEIIPCQNGFHACENPLDIFNYYDMIESRFAQVEQGGDIKEDRDKTCSSRIKIKAELKLADIIRLGVEWIIDKTKINGSSGYSAQIGSSGDYAKIGSSGDSAKIGSSGYSAQIGSSGDSAKIGSSGDYAKIGSSGDYAKIGSSGYSAQIGSSGYSAQIGSSGDSAQIGSSGYSAQIESTGKDSVICCAGCDSKVKAKKGSWITLSEWKSNKPICVKTEYVDGERIKEDTWYELKDGEFQICQEQK